MILRFLPSFSRIASRVLKKKTEKMQFLAFQCRCSTVLDGMFQSQSWGHPAVGEDDRGHKGISLLFFDAYIFKKSYK